MLSKITTWRSHGSGHSYAANRYKDPYPTTRIQWKVRPVFFVGWLTGAVRETNTENLADSEKRWPLWGWWKRDPFKGLSDFYVSLRIQVCPKKGVSPIILFWGWDWDHQSYFREGYGFLGYNKVIQRSLWITWCWWFCIYNLCEELECSHY